MVVEEVRVQCERLLANFRQSVEITIKQIDWNLEGKDFKNVKVFLRELNQTFKDSVLRKKYVELVQTPFTEAAELLATRPRISPEELKSIVQKCRANANIFLKELEKQTNKVQDAILNL